ncbi:MAG: hypothetical protein AAF203_00340, partial [Pseudomonadota bacterium]
FGLSFFTFFILPILNIVPLRGSLVYADRYLYLAGVGCFFAYGHILQTLFLNFKTTSKKIILSMGVTALMVYNLNLFHQRIHIWKDSFTLWEDILKTTPGSVIGNMQLAMAYLDLGQIDKALFYGKKGYNENPSNASVNYSMGVFQFNKGDLKESLMHIEKVLSTNPNHAKGLSLKALVYKKQGKMSEAKNLMARALQINPTNSTVQTNHRFFLTQ